MFGADSGLPFYLGIIELLLSLWLILVAFAAMRHSQGRSFSLAMKALFAAALLFFTMQAVSFFRLVPPDVLGISDAISSIILLLLLISALRELTKGMLAHEHLIKGRQHYKRDVE